MNIFTLHQDPFICAQQHCDKHVVKMILEYAQLLSTAHRLLDGKKENVKSSVDAGPKFGITVKNKNYWVLPGEALPHVVLERDENFEVTGTRWHTPAALCYQATHANHPSTVWARKTSENYEWLLQLLEACLDEYTFRYGKVHKTATVLKFLQTHPKNIPIEALTPFAQAMPDEYKVENSIEAYHRFYVAKKADFAKWTKRPIPEWFIERLGITDCTPYKGKSKMN